MIVLAHVELPCDGCLGGRYRQQIYSDSINLDPCRRHRGKATMLEEAAGIGGRNLVYANGNGVAQSLVCLRTCLMQEYTACLVDRPLMVVDTPR